MDRPITTDRFVLRAYRGPEDHPAMARIAAAVRAFNGDSELGTVADMDNHYAHFEHADLPRDCALVELDGGVVAYARASRLPLANGGLQVEGILNIDPVVRGRGVEELLIGHAVARATAIVTEIGGNPGPRLVIYVTGRDPAQQRVAEAHGFRRVRRSAQLVRPNVDDIPDLPIPEPFEVRPIDPADRAMHRRVFDASARAFADSHGEAAATDAQFDEFLNDPRFDPRLWRVAFHGDELAGQILSYMGEPEPDGSRIGFTEGISVQAEYRRRGLARALLADSLRAVRDAGATRAGLGVDTQNPNRALSLYESLGFRIVSEEFEYELGPLPLGRVPATDGTGAR